MFKKLVILLSAVIFSLSFTVQPAYAAIQIHAKQSNLVYLTDQSLHSQILIRNPSSLIAELVTSDALSSGMNVQDDLIHFIQGSIDGFGLLSSVEELAKDYLRDANDDAEKAIKSLLFWQSTKAASVGFITGLGGVATLPVSIPTALLANYSLSARQAAAIAYLRGYDIASDQVQTAVLLCLLGDSLETVLAQSGIEIGKSISLNLLNQLPGKTLMEINKQVGFRLLTKFGQTGVVNLVKGIPVIGGVCGGAINAVYINQTGKVALRLFKTSGAKG